MFTSAILVCVRYGLILSRTKASCVNTAIWSRKLEDYCLARMHVKHYQSKGRVEVTYICTHTHHSLRLEECKYLPLSQSVRKEIQEKFVQGVTLERIMDGIHV